MTVAGFFDFTHVVLQDDVNHLVECELIGFRKATLTCRIEEDNATQARVLHPNVDGTVKRVSGAIGCDSIGCNRIRFDAAEDERLDSLSGDRLGRRSGSWIALTRKVAHIRAIKR